MVFALVALCVQAQNHKSGVDWNGNNWMSNLPDDALVCQLSLPGAHDAATGENDWAIEALVTGPLNSQAQDVKVSVMRENGVRVFDVRPSLSGNVLYNSHGIARINKTVESLLDDMIAFLDAHPSEFFIFHIFHGGSEWKGAEFAELLAKDKFKSRLVPFRNTLTVGEMRGKLLFLCRHDHAGTPWDGGFLRNWGEHNYENDRNSYINVNGIDDYNYNDGAASLCVQDFSGPVRDGEVESKKESIGRLLDYSTHHTVAQPGQAVWTFNFASGYSKVLSLFGNDISLSDGYRDNATHANKYIYEYLTREDYQPGPTGMMMIDYVCTETTNFNDSRYSSIGNETYGYKVVEAIIDNNFRCKPEQLKMPSYEQTKSLLFSSNPDIHCSEGVPGENELMPQHRGYALWGDYNGDGLMDLFYGGTSMAMGWGSYPCLVTNKGEGQFDLSYSDNGLPIVAYGLGSVTLDYNQDGILDMLFLNIGGNNTWHSDYFNGENTDRGELLLVKGLGDGQFEVVPDETLRTLGYKVGADVSWNYGRKACIMNVGDYDNDGYPDFVFQGDNHDVGLRFVKVLHNNHGNGFTVAQTLCAQSEGGVTFGDFNADGWQDIVCVGWEDDGMSIRFYRGTGNESVPFEEVTEEVMLSMGYHNMSDFRHQYGMYQSVITALDYNQDGSLDVYIGGSHKDDMQKQAMVLLNEAEPGSRVFSFSELPTTVAPFSTASDYLYTMVDLNGDDCPDVLQQGWANDGRRMRYGVSITNGSVGSYTNTHFDTEEQGNTLFGGAWSIESNPGTMSFGDFNDDGKLDLASVGWSDRRKEKSEIFYNITPDATPVAPATPVSVEARYDDGKVIVSWEPSALAVTGGCPMYNIFLRNQTTGDVRILVPAVLDNGKQKGYASFNQYYVSGDEKPVYIFNNVSEDRYTVGVQAVSYNYSASEFNMANVTGTRYDYIEDYGTIEFVANDTNGRYYATFSSDRPVIIDAQQAAEVQTVLVESNALRIETIADGSVSCVTDMTKNDGCVEGYYVPANTGVLVCSADGQPVKYYYSINNMSNTLEKIAPESNMLRAASVAKETDGSYIFYQLAWEDETRNPSTLGFWWGAANGGPFKSRAGTAYLAIPVTSGNAKGYTLLDEETGIRGVHFNENDDPSTSSGQAGSANSIYNIAGQRVTLNGYKGIVIVNGRKFVNK